MDIKLMEFVFVRMLTVNSQMVMLEWVQCANLGSCILFKGKLELHN